MKTDFEIKLEGVFTVCGDCGCGTGLDKEAIEEIKQIVTYTFMKVVPEKRKRDSSHLASEECYSEGYGDAAKDMEADIKKELA